MRRLQTELCTISSLRYKEVEVQTHQPPNFTPFKKMIRNVWRTANQIKKRSFATSNSQSGISQLLLQVANGSISANEAEKTIKDMGALNANGKSPDESLSSFANLDHRRSSRTGFPEVRLFHQVHLG